MKSKINARGLMAGVSIVALLASDAAIAAPLTNPDGGSTTNLTATNTTVDSVSNFGGINNHSGTPGIGIFGTVVTGGVVNDNTSPHTGDVYVLGDGSSAGMLINGTSGHAASIGGDIQNIGATIQADAVYSTQGLLPLETPYSATAYGLGLKTTSDDVTFGHSILNTGAISGGAVHYADPTASTTQAVSAHANGYGVFVGNVGVVDIDNQGSIYGTARAFVNAPSSTPNDATSHAAGIELSGTTLSGSITNSGLIQVEATAAQTPTAYGIILTNGATVAGTITNTGTIYAHNDVVFGTVDSLGDAVNTVGAGGSVVVQQQNGIFNGNLRTANAHTDTFEYSGGSIGGDLYADANDKFDIFAGASSSLSYGGNIDGFGNINVNNLSHAGTPVQLMLGGNVTDTVFLNVNANGTLVVDSSANITVDTYNQAGTGKVVWNVTPSGAGVIHATDVSLASGATSGAALSGGVFASDQSFVVLNATHAPTGSFASFSSTGGSPFYNVTGSWTGNDYVIHVVRITDTPSPSAPVLIVPGLTPDGLSLANQLQDIIAALDPSSPLIQALGDLIEQSPSQYAAAINAIAGSQNADMAIAGLAQSGELFKIVFSQIGGFGGFASLGSNIMVADNKVSTGTMTDAGPSYTVGGVQNGQAMSGWVRVFGNWSQLDASSKSTGYKSNGGGVVAGLDYQFDNLVAGAFFGYQKQNLRFNGTGAGDVKSLDFGAYAKYRAGDLHIDGVAGYSHQKYALDRRFTILGTGYTAFRHNNGNTLAAALEAAYDFKLGEGTFQPFLNVHVSRTRIDGTTETGAGPFNLVLGKQTLDSERTKLGARWQETFQSDQQWSLTPMFELGWRHEFGDKEATQTSAFSASPGNAFQVTGTAAPRDAAALGAGMTLKFNESFDATVKYDGEIGKNFDSHTASVKFVLRF